MSLPQPLLLLFALLAVALSACGGSDDATVSGSGPSGSGPTASAGGSGLAHIHGLGVSDGTLLIATHTGLWVAAEGQTQARRFGNSTQDIMGFSVLDKDRFIGSGHPDPSQSLPPNLGLIESRDAGKSWETRSSSRAFSTVPRKCSGVAKPRASPELRCRSCGSTAVQTCAPA